jgi:fatty-acid desaturase
MTLNGKERFIKREEKYRKKYGEGLFQKKFIRKYKHYIELTQWVLPLTALLSFLNAGIQFANNDVSSDNRYLIIVIIWSLSGLLWSISAVYHYVSFYGFLRKRIAVWEEELSQMEGELSRG